MNYISFEIKYTVFKEGKSTLQLAACRATDSEKHEALGKSNGKKCQNAMLTNLDSVSTPLNFVWFSIIDFTRVVYITNNYFLCVFKHIKKIVLRNSTPNIKGPFS